MPFRKLFPELPQGKLEISQFSAGHSNLTYCLKIADFEAVLRRPPLGPVAKKAHDMKRSLQFYQHCIHFNSGSQAVCLCRGSRHHR